MSFNLRLPDSTLMVLTLASVSSSLQGPTAWASSAPALHAGIGGATVRPLGELRIPVGKPLQTLTHAERKNSELSTVTKTMSILLPSFKRYVFSPELPQLGQDGVF